MNANHDLARPRRPSARGAAGPAKERHAPGAGRQAALGNRGLARVLGSASLEAQAERAASAFMARGAAPAIQSRLDAAGAGRPGRGLEPVLRGECEAAFGQDFSNVRIHDDAGVQRQLKAAHALAFTNGDDIAFAPGAYSPATPAGRRLLAHELAHVVQQRGGTPGAGAMPPLDAAPESPQPQGDREALLARLKVVQARLAQLRAQQDQRSDAFAGSMMKERLAQSLEQGTRELSGKARSEIAAGRLMGGAQTVQNVQRAVTVAQSGNLVTLTMRLQIAYDGLADADGRKRAAADIPRIEAAIRDVWQVDFAEGEYAGVQLRTVPIVSYMPKNAARAANAFLIRVRKPDRQPSSGEPLDGTISLAPVHLDGSRVIVVAHELAHLFGFVDAYLQMLPGKKPGDKEKWAVGRYDAQGRADLMGLIDPKVLARLRGKDAIPENEFKRQSGPVRIWEQEAGLVLRALGVMPPAPAPPTFDSEDFDPRVELDRIEREGERKLRAVQARRARVDNSLQWLQAAEEAIALEREEKDLQRRLAATPATP